MKSDSDWIQFLTLIAQTPIMKFRFAILFFVFPLAFHLHAQQKDTIPYSSYADDGTFITLNHGDFVSKRTVSFGADIMYFRNGGMGPDVGFSYYQPTRFYIQSDWVVPTSIDGSFSARGMYILYGKEDSVRRQVVTGAIHYFSYGHGTRKRFIYSRADVINKFYAGLHGGIAVSYSAHSFPDQTELCFGGGILLTKHYQVFYSHIDNRLAQRERSHKVTFYADACYYPQTSLDEQFGRFIGYRFYFDITQSFYWKYDFGVNLKLGISCDGFQTGPILGLSLYGGF